MTVLIRGASAASGASSSVWSGRCLMRTARFAFSEVRFAFVTSFRVSLVALWAASRCAVSVTSSFLTTSSSAICPSMGDVCAVVSSIYCKLFAHVAHARNEMADDDVVRKLEEPGRIPGSCRKAADGSHSKEESGRKRNAPRRAERIARRRRPNYTKKKRREDSANASIRTMVSVPATGRAGGGRR